ISGEMVSQLAVQTLISMGMEVIDLGLSTTPTVEMAVPLEGAGAGIIFTASHNPKQWNALKFLTQTGEFISAAVGQEIIDTIDSGKLHFADVDSLGSYRKMVGYIDKHIDILLDLPYVNIDLVKSKNFHVVVDCINSTGAISIPPLLDKLGVTYTLINEEVNGQFAHNPEPLPAHLIELSKTIQKEKAHLGISVDPDVDRLAFVNEDGSMFGEEYTLVAVADYILSIKNGNTVSNLSSTRALADITTKHGASYSASAVGEVNVVNMMKATNAVIGGEGNGGIILPELHYGRDALVGIAIMLTHLANDGRTMSELKASYPPYKIVKDRLQLTKEMDVDGILKAVETKFKDERVNTIDGVKIDFKDGWVHLRKSNTEPIIRIYSESKDIATATALGLSVKNTVLELI
ncbi:phosphoglucosamine mutase, partial [bacterium]|nr:phosphoglucosamine mutase [bacterium]